MKCLTKCNVFISSVLPLILWTRFQRLKFLFSTEIIKNASRRNVHWPSAYPWKSFEWYRSLAKNLGGYGWAKFKRGGGGLIFFLKIVKITRGPKTFLQKCHFLEKNVNIFLKKNTNFSKHFEGGAGRVYFQPPPTPLITLVYGLNEGESSIIFLNVASWVQGP